MFAFEKLHHVNKIRRREHVCVPPIASNLGFVLGGISDAEAGFFGLANVPGPLCYRQTPHAAALQPRRTSNNYMGNSGDSAAWLLWDFQSGNIFRPKSLTDAFVSWYLHIRRLWKSSSMADLSAKSSTSELNRPEHDVQISAALNCSVPTACRNEAFKISVQIRAFKLL